MRARSTLFWPKLAADVNDYISNCAVCLKYSYSNPKESLEPHPIPSRPWQIVGTDLFEWDNKMFIILVDYYSCFFEVSELHSTTSNTVVRKLKPMFARFGIPERVISDNSPQFSSQEFSDFARKYDFQHTTSSPCYPQSNGMAEKYVQIAKRIFKKTKLDGRDPLLGILEYRTTPLETGYSPAQLLQGRQLRTTLPTLPEQLKPKPINHTEVRYKLEQIRQNEKKHYDKGSRSLPPVKVGQNVHVQNQDKSWKRGTIIGEAGPRSYIISSQGGIYRRNRRHILNKPGKTHFAEPSNSNSLQDAQIISPSPANPTSIPTENPSSPGTNTNATHTSSKPTTSQTHTTSKPKITRYGRICKPNVKPSM